jgi:beta-glucosidase
MATQRTGPQPATTRLTKASQITNRQTFWQKSLQQYVPAIQKHDVGTVMPSYSSVDWTEDGVGNPIKMHGNKELLTDVLKGSMDFGGFVISDWEGIHQLPGDWRPRFAPGSTPGST